MAAMEYPLQGQGGVQELIKSISQPIMKRSLISYTVMLWRRRSLSSVVSMSIYSRQHDTKVYGLMLCTRMITRPVSAVTKQTEKLSCSGLNSVIFGLIRRIK